MSATVNLAARLGPQRVITAENELAASAVNGMVPTAIVRPASSEEVAATVRFALAEKLAILPVGSRSKLDLGAPLSRYDIAMDMTGLREIVHYDAGDMTLGVDAGHPLCALQDFLKQHGQFLPLAVPCFETTTLGGTVGSGIDSMLRQQYGPAREFLIGAEFVDGTGQLCKSGGRVVKNVTGYDLHKLLIGSLGTLAVITRLNFRTFPLPAASGACLSCFLNAEDALDYRRNVGKAGLSLSSLEVFNPSAVELLQAILLHAGSSTAQLFDPAQWHVYCSFQGNQAVVRRVSADLEKAASANRALRSQRLDVEAKETIGALAQDSFAWLRNLSPAILLCRLAFLGITAESLFELSRLAETSFMRNAIVVRSAGIVYFCVYPQQQSGLEANALLRVAAVAQSIALARQGAMTVLHAPLVVKRAAASRGDTKLNLDMQLRVKNSFDPSGIFAPGRIVGSL